MHSIHIFNPGRLSERLSFPAKILASFTLSALLLIGSLLLFGADRAKEQDRAEITYTTNAIHAAIDTKAKNFRSWLKGYALWDELYAHMVKSTDLSWTNDNVGPGVWKSFTMPMKGIYISDAADRPLYRYWADGKAPDLTTFTGVKLPLLRQAADKTDTPIVKIILFDGQPYFLGLSRIRPTNGMVRDAQDPKRYMIWVQPIAGRVLDEIGQSMAISGLRWETGIDRSDTPWIRVFADRTVDAGITWNPRRPGSMMLKNGWLPALSLIIVTCLVGLGQYLLARRLNQLLLDKQAEAETQAAQSRHASLLSQQAEQAAQALMARLLEQEQAVARLSQERDRDRARRKQEVRDKSLAMLSMFEEDFDTVLRPMLEIAMLLNSQSGELERDAEAGREATAIVASSAQHSTASIDIVVDGNQALNQATTSLDGNVSAAVASTRRAEQTIDDLVARLADLSANTLAVEGVVSSVAAIAARTNTLALNARIEAARAGESGRGFAIVADEVRQMAELTSQSTASITAVLRMMQDTAQTATSGVHAMRDMVGEIAVVTGSSRAALDHQSVVAGEIHDAIISTKARMTATDAAIRQLEWVIGSSERTAKAVTSAAGELRERSRELQARAGQFAEALRQESQA
ncbi:methyl-accepting chemotaxis protein [Sphingobium sp. HWE2-09]|uniref:methyl-accepting chemotaxis protein n=1 Tax=Sphingobium sp. HWE2-09 TaxID=3108390 RepID=UPI002DCA50FC|nr:methyl-accepting chemotaxis protein [Sphingobium sp. HWE2-09]